MSGITVAAIGFGVMLLLIALRMPVGLSPGAFCQLGVDAAPGVRAWDQQARIALRIGPLDLAYFEGLLPDRPLLRELVSLVRAYVGYEVGFAVNPVLARDAVPALAMSQPDPSGSAGAGPLLGWNTWLPTSRATLVTCSAKTDSVSVIELIVSASAATSPRA